MRSKYLIVQAVFGLFALALCSLMPTTLRGQYFGRNKVQYDNFKFKILKTKHFDIYFYPREQEAAKQAARMAERWFARHTFILQDTLHGRQPLILYASFPQFKQTNAISGPIGEGTGGVTEALKRRIVLPFAGPLAETDHVIGHELVHAFQYDITGQGGGSYQAPVALRLPLWFIEGMAEFLSIGPVDPHTAMWIRDAAKFQKRLPSLLDLENPNFFPYRWGQALLAYVAGRWGDGTIGDLLKQAGRSGDIYAAIQQVLGITADSLAKDWHKDIHRVYDPIMKLTESPDRYGKRLITKEKEGGAINVGPVLSPDGSRMIFFSERNLFSIDLFLADAATGKIVRKISASELDPHYESLEFIRSAGTWSPDGKSIALAIITKGKPTLSLLQVEQNKVTREIPFPVLDEIFNPSWSPDGQRIAFSALTGGMTDLFIFDLHSNKLQRITQDMYTDIHPAWSPDGRYLAFSTDRFSTQLSDLQTGPIQLALYEVATGKLLKIPAFKRGKQINPQWSADGKNLYFLSDRTGITNVYRLHLASGEIFQITNLYTGVSGITALSPAISTGYQSHKLSFCVYENGKYDIYMMEAPEILQGKPVSTTDASLTQAIGQEAPALPINPAALPPIQRVSVALDSVLHNWQMGLADAEPEKVVNYKPKLSLTYIGQPYVAAGYDTYGAHLGGGIALFWSDLLGNHNLATALQVEVDGKFKDVAGQIGYTNNSKRWNWGLLGQQFPYITSQFAVGTTFIDSTSAYVEQQLRSRQLNREVAGFLSYPFNQSQRIEFKLGFQNISFKDQVRTRAFSIITGEKIIDETRDLPSMPSINLAKATAALVYDTAIYGATSPIYGQSYRFELSPMIGSITLTNILADYRRYFMPVRPFTIATRLLHFGRYGKDAEDQRLVPLFLGYPGLVRGYDSNSFTNSECVATDSDNCPVFNQLIGSKIAIANLELRFPLFQVLGLGQGYYGVLPIETGIFYDAGIAWTDDDKATFLGGNRSWVKSYGAVMRLNLGGILLVELDYVNPVDRPQKGWFWQFNFVSGF